MPLRHPQKDLLKLYELLAYLLELFPCVQTCRNEHLVVSRTACVYFFAKRSVFFDEVVLYRGVAVLVGLVDGELTLLVEREYPFQAFRELCALSPRYDAGFGERFGMCHRGLDIER